ncbi:MAG TPA: alkaline phosphatase family protein [Candidatus Acidoferrales bacterium]|nr:alkaline phosphatase family protein [Candidatus Acidoferrales bacterium]
MTIWRPLLGALVAAALAALRASPATGAEPVQAIIVAFDGFSGQRLAELVRAGKLPNFARLIAGGAFSDSVTTVFPSKTAPAFASLWTGAGPRVTGISGNLMPRTPRSSHTIAESRSGFFSDALLAEPLWVSAARAGLKSVVLQATHAWPFDRYITSGAPAEASERLVLFEGYATYAGSNGVVSRRLAKPAPASGWQNAPASLKPPLEILFRVGGATVFGLMIDDPAESSSGYDTLLVAGARDGRQIHARLKPGAPGSLDSWSDTVELEKLGGAGVRFRLFDLKPDGSDYLLYFTHPAREQGTSPQLVSALRKEAGMFVGHGASVPYVQGLLGRPLFRGGDGTAEQRYMETVRLNLRRLTNWTRWAMRNLQWDLLFTYTNYPDEAEHLWRGFLDPGLSGYRRDLAERLEPFLDQVYAGCDDFLGEVLRLAPQNTIIAVVSDHGIEGVNRAVRVNVALERAGLLALDARGKLDLSRTKALYPSGDNSYVLINTTDRKGGIVSPAERAEVAARVGEALSRVTDLGRKVVTAIYDAESEGARMAIGGAAGGDLYLDLAPGYAFDPYLGKGDVVVAREPYGMHGFNPARASMRAMMIFYGPGVHRGRKLTGASTNDFAPTLSRLLGIPPPRDASGDVLKEALLP